MTVVLRRWSPIEGVTCVHGRGAPTPRQLTCLTDHDRRRAAAIGGSHRAEAFLRGRVLLHRLGATRGASVSHAGDDTVAASHATPVGVDLVRLDTDPGRIPRAALTGSALIAVATHTRLAAPQLLVWAATESALKAAGVGLTVPLADLCWTATARGCVVDARPAAAGVWRVAFTTEDELLIAVAVADG